MVLSTIEIKKIKNRTILEDCVMMKTRIFIILLSGFVCANISFAEKMGQLGIAIGGNELFSKDELSFDNSTINLNYTIPGNTSLLGEALSKRLDYRLDLEYSEVDNDPKGSVSGLIRPSANLVYAINPDHRATAFVLGGLGYEVVSGGREGFDSHLFGQIGLGVNFDLTSKIDLYGEIKSLGIIGGEDEEEVENVALVGVKFDVGRPKRRLNDDDNDGVINELDKCPGTLDIFTVDRVGCPAASNLGVNFETNSANILNHYNSKLTEFVNFLKNSPSYRVKIEGHTDSVGSSASNLILSNKRALAVKNRLIASGIASTRLSSTGFGESQPVASNETDTGKALNRRVIARLTNQ